MRSLGFKVTEEQAQKIGDRLDQEKKGSITYEQFKDYMNE